MAGAEKRLLLVFPQQSRNKQTMAPALCAQRLKAARGRVGAWTGAQGSGGSIAFCRLHLGGQRAGCLWGQGSGWRAASLGWAAFQGLSIHFPLLRVAIHPASPAHSGRQIQFLTKEDKTQQIREKGSGPVSCAVAA